MSDKSSGRIIIDHPRKVCARGLRGKFIKISALARQAIGIDQTVELSRDKNDLIVAPAGKPGPGAYIGNYRCSCDKLSIPNSFIAHARVEIGDLYIKYLCDLNGDRYIRMRKFEL
jgi:hypothetical protein